MPGKPPEAIWCVFIINALFTLRTSSLNLLHLLTGDSPLLPFRRHGHDPASLAQAAGIIPATTGPDLNPMETDRDGTIIAPEGYRPVWSDEGNTKGKHRPNSKSWTLENGFTRNQERQR